jgi:predicted RNA-binding Zn-ribbon protein involved in translation (DUF1610 family)
MREKLQRFMMGRYGVDAFGKFLTGATFVLIAISFFWRTTGLNILLLFAIFYSYFRMFSRNYAKRSMENQKYLKMTEGIRNWIQKTKRNIARRKQFRYFSCPKCGKKVRVPRGRGKICITCPECRHEFIKNS